ncbi:MAG: HD domain-containing protein [Deltaproteobacteria bacterium]|nr:HD domain-containing protein [Deltaproteobacteria bacterium]
MPSVESKKIYVSEITENTQVEGLFLVKDKNNGITKNGKQYIALNLTDKTGEVKARIWDNAEKLGVRFSQGDCVNLKAFSVMYQGTLQLNITGIEKLKAGEELLRELLPAARSNSDELFSELLDMRRTFSNPHLSRLLELVFSRDDIVTAFKAAPAAKSIHHDYLGGLIEHTAHVARLALAVAPLYPTLNKDLLLTGAILHDIGKIYELSYEKSFSYTDRGRLIGHITLGDAIVNDAIRQLPEFPDDLALVVRHLLLSHHGQYEFGSPKRPKIPEALLLSYLDDLDAKMFVCNELIRKEKNSESKWTSYNKLFDRYLYTDTFIDTERQADSDD